MRLELLLSRADDDSPVLDPGIPSSLVRPEESREGPELPRALRDDSSDPNDLGRQRWGVIAPEGPDGDRLLSAIEPLRKAREEAQGGAPARIYRVPRQMDSSLAAAWKRQVYWDESAEERDLPRYLLLLGDLDVMPLPLQEILSIDAFVGRLAFTDEEGYQAYAAKVLFSERTASAEARARALFYAVGDGTAATKIGYEALMAPCLSRSREESAKGRFPAREIVALSDAPPLSGSALSREVSSGGPSVLFSISHGLGAPLRGFRSATEQRALQGAMRLAGGLRLTAADVKDKPFLPGGVWFYLACFGAGTPAASVYHPWLADLRERGVFTGSLEPVLKNLPQPGDRPFIAALPEALLRNPLGPLAFIGHIDLAFTYAFRDDDEQHRSRGSRFQGIFRSLVDGARVGVAHHALSRFSAETAVELSTLYGATQKKTEKESSPEDAARKAELWLLQHDIAGYILLGDPAVRLPLAGGSTQAPSRELSPSAASVLGFSPTAEGEPIKVVDIDAMEDAALALLSRQDRESAIAQKRGIDRADLVRWAEAYRKAGREALSKLRG